MYASLSTIKKEIWTAYPVCYNSKKSIHGWLKMERLSKLRSQIQLTSLLAHVGLVRSEWGYKEDIKADCPLE